MKSALANFQTLPLKDAARQLLAKLGYKSDKFLVGAGSKPQDFLVHFASGHPFDPAMLGVIFRKAQNKIQDPANWLDRIGCKT